MADDGGKVWMVRVAGDVRGPVSLEEMRQAAEAGRIPSDAKVAMQGDPSWRALRDVVGVSGGAPAPATARAPSVGAWAKVTAIGSVLAPVAMIGLGVLGWKVHDDDEIRSKADAAALRAELGAVESAVKAASGGTWVRGTDTAHECQATNQLFECTVTNVTAHPIEACWIGQLAQKKGGGSMRSFPLCTGRVGPRETRSVSTPWERGSASDICNKVSVYGNSVLDFDACEFDSQPVDPPTESVPTPVAAGSGQGSPTALP
jgi:hypothetical protein